MNNYLDLNYFDLNYLTGMINDLAE